MLEKCKNAYDRFMENYCEWNYCVPDDGGFDFLQRLNDFKRSLEMDGIIFKGDEVEAMLEFDTNDDAKEFFNMVKWLNGKDYHFTSCQVIVELEDNRIKFIGLDW